MTNANPTPEHKERIKRELRQAGATSYGLLKQESRYLPRLIHPDEPIGGIVYGHYKNGSAMLVATDRRVIFLDRKPGYTISEELTYEVVAGVSYNRQGRFAAVTLHTRLGDFSLRFINLKAAETFVHYIEDRRLENMNSVITNGTSPIPKIDTDGLTPQAIGFLQNHDIATLSTVDKDGNVYGAVVYYVYREKRLFILTKSETQKAHNIFSHRQVALTVFDALTFQTLQLQGAAGVEADPTIKNFVFSQIVRPRVSVAGHQLPPVTQLDAGSYLVIGIKPTNVSFRDFGQKA